MINSEKPTKIFDVHGPFPIKPTEVKLGRRIEKDQRRLFWEHNPDADALRGKIGCYVFAIRAAKGIRPVYVGKATKTFEQEIFGSHQRDYYNQELMDILKGQPVMFLLIFPGASGVANNKMIKDLEEFLIQVAVTKNPDLRNVHGKREKKWGIRGILRSGQGKMPISSKIFKAAMGIQHRQR